MTGVEGTTEEVMGAVRIETRADGKVGVKCGYRDHDNIEQIPGALWDKDEREWTVRLSWAALVQLRGVFGARLEVGPNLAAAARQVHEQRVAPAMAMRESADCPWVEDDQLTPLQKVASGFAVIGGSVLLGDPMGSGKTPEAIVAIRQLRALYEAGADLFPALIVCGHSAKPHWKDEFADWWPEPDVSVIHGTAPKRRKQIETEADIYVVSWPLLAKHTRLMNFGNTELSDSDKEPKEFNTTVIPKTVIADELHRALNPQTKTTRALWWIGDHADRRIGMTGTLINNSVVDLWAAMRFIAPDEYPSKTKWLDRYGLLSYNYWGALEVVGLKPETRDELFSFFDARFIRRPREVILPELKGKLKEVDRYVQLPPKQRKPYNELRDTMLADLKGGVLMESNPAQRFLRLRQFTLATCQLDDDENVVMGLPSAKADDFHELLQDAAEDEQVVCYAVSKRFLHLLHDYLAAKDVTVALYTGDIPLDEREANRKRFQDRNDPLRVLLMTYGAGSESINLSQTDILVKIEQSTSKRENDQSEDRPMRHGRTTELRVVNIVADDTVDERSFEILRAKDRQFEEVARDEETAKKWLK